MTAYTETGHSRYTVLTIVMLSRQNTSYTFRRALDSLRMQTLNECEILVIDRNEPGDPYSLSLQEDISKYPDIHLLPVVSSGGADCRNAALHAAKGEFISFMDGTDVWQPEKSEAQIRVLEKDPCLAAVCCNGHYPEKLPGGTEFRPIFTITSPNPAQWIIQENFKLSSQCVYRTEALRGIGGFDGNLSAEYDVDAMMRMARQYQVKFIPDILFTSEKQESNHSLLNEYEATRYLLYKYYDDYLRSRKLAHDFQIRLGMKAFAVKLWPHAVIHFLLAFFKAPIYSINRLLRHVFGCLSRWMRISFRRIRLLLLRTHLLRKLLKMHKRIGSSAVPDAPTSVSSQGTVDVSVNPALDEHPLQFAFHRQLRSVIIPHHTIRIARGMFAGCANLEKVVIPPTVMRIEDDAFLGCSHLSVVEFLPGSMLTHVGAHAFAGCASLTSIVLSSTVSSFGPWAFAGCSHLQTIQFHYVEHGVHTVSSNFPTMITKIPRGLFAGCLTLGSIASAEGSLLSCISDNAFLGCRMLSSVYLNGSIVSIGQYAFADCQRLENFVLPKIDGVSKIGQSAFRGCAALAYFRFPYALTVIQRWSFYGCASLRYLKLSKNIRLIDKHAFEACSALEYVILERPGVCIARGAFDGDVPMRVRAEESNTL